MTEPLLRLRLLESLYGNDEDDGAAGPHLHRLRGVDALRKRERLGRQKLRSRLALGANDGQDGVDIFGVDTGEDGGAATAQEAAGAAYLCRGVAPLHQLLDEGVRVRVRCDDDEELLIRLPRLPLCPQSGGLEFFFLFAVPLYPLAKDPAGLAARLRGDQKTEANAKGDAENEAEDEPHYPPPY